MSAIAEVIAARENVIKTVLGALLAECDLNTPEASAAAVTDAWDKIALASRDLVRATDSLPIGRQPKGWVTTVEAAL